MSDLEQSITDNAKGPAKASGDSGSVEQHNLKDQVEADRYLAARNAVKTKKLGLKITKIVPPGAV